MTNSSHFGNKIASAQAILDAHELARQKIEVANKAVLEAIRTILDFNDPIASNLFDCDEQTLGIIASAPKSQLQCLLMTGVPIFKLRLGTKEFASALDSKKGNDVYLQILLKSFSAPLDISSLA